MDRHSGRATKSVVSMPGDERDVEPLREQLGAPVVELEVDGDFRVPRQVLAEDARDGPAEDLRRHDANAAARLDLQLADAIDALREIIDSALGVLVVGAPRVRELQLPCRPLEEA